MNYSLHQLQIFLKVVETKSITKAAIELHLTQPAVSIQLKKFQEQFNVPLVEVIGRQIYITDFGREISVIADRIINEINTINDKTLNYKGILSGRLKISIVSTGKYIMPYFLSDFLKRNENIEITMDVTNKSKVLESLNNNEIDFALVSVLPNQLLINEEILLENHLYLIGNRESNFKGIVHNKSILNEIPLIYRESGSATRLIMEQFFEKNNVSVKKKLELTSNEAVKQAVIAGLGYSVMPLIGIHNELLTNDLKIIKVVGLPIKSTWKLIWLKNKKLTPIAKAYLIHLQENKQKILKKNFVWINNSIV